MGRAIDLTGMKYGRLTVIERRGSDKGGNALWLCKCDCGNEIVASSNNLKRGHTTSCGCYKNDKSKERMKEMWKDEEFRQNKSDKMIGINKKQWEDEEFRQRQSNKMREQWEDEEFKQKRINEAKERTGENGANYKGGISPISKYLRNLPVVEQWCNDCKQQVNYTCELTGRVGVELNTHHLYGFNLIVLDAHKLYNIEIKKQIKDYTKEDLKLLAEYVINWHKDNSNAVVLCKEMHDLFHDIYGYGDNTEEQYIEFKERKQRGDI